MLLIVLVPGSVVNRVGCFFFGFFHTFSLIVQILQYVRVTNVLKIVYFMPNFDPLLKGYAKIDQNEPKDNVLNLNTLVF